MPRKRILRVPKLEVQLIKGELEEGRHIPNVLLSRVGSTRFLSYSSMLRRFSSSYGGRRFGSLDEEYETVYLFAREILRRSQGKALGDALQVSKRLELIHQTHDTEFPYRDHFIHSVQDFLLGAVILDTYYNDFKKWYSRALCNNARTSVEASWLLASVFHDRRRTFEDRRWLGEEEGAPITQSFDLADEYLANLSALDSYLKKGKRLDLWHYKRDQLSQRGKCFRLLEKYYKLQNHGVLSAMTLLLRFSQISDGTILPHVGAAALAIATHDGKPRREFLSNGLFPMQIEMLPISCLLLYCDAIQEWGRPLRLRDDDVRLVRLETTSNEVHCEVSFSDSKRASDKIEECSTVRKSIRSTGLAFSFSPRLMVTEPSDD